MSNFIYIEQTRNAITDIPQRYTPGQKASLGCAFNTRNSTVFIAAAVNELCPSDTNVIH